MALLQTEPPLVDRATELKKLSPQRGDLVVLRYPGPLTDLDKEEIRFAMWQSLEKIGLTDRDVRLLILSNGLDLDSLSEDEMRSLGYVKAETKFRQFF